MEYPITRISYCYRDASNWKFCGEIVVEGNLKRSQLESYLLNGEWFVPEKVGLKLLLTEPWSEDDRLLHELHEFEETVDSNAVCSADLIVQQFESAHQKGWFNGY